MLVDARTTLELRARGVLTQAADLLDCDDLVEAIADDGTEHLSAEAALYYLRNRLASARRQIAEARALLELAASK